MFTPVSLSLLRRWLEPRNPDGSSMQIGDDAKDWNTLANSGRDSVPGVGIKEQGSVTSEPASGVVDPTSEPKQPQRSYRAPVGARFCDRLCFANTLLELESSLVVSPQEPSTTQE